MQFVEHRLYIVRKTCRQFLHYLGVITKTLSGQTHVLQLHAACCSGSIAMEASTLEIRWAYPKQLSPRIAELHCRTDAIVPAYIYDEMK